MSKIAMHKLTAASLVALALAGTAAAALAPAASATDSPRCSQDGYGSKLTVVALTADGKLACFREHKPERARLVGAVSGLEGDARLVGIDYRPATGDLYGLGNAGGIYVIDTKSASATKKSQANMPLNGTSFGVDFNPVVDRLRVVSDAGQNIAINVTDGTVAAGTALNTGPNTTSLGITGAAYTNNDADAATATTLFDLDTTNDQVAVQSPPNGGALAPTGKLGVDATGDTGFDIYTVKEDGATVGNRAFASITSASSSQLASVNLLTGRATTRGWFPWAVADIAIPTS